MKLTLSATVISVAPTDLSGFVGGTHAVGLDVTPALQNLVTTARDATAVLRTSEGCAGMAERLYGALASFDSVPWDDSHSTPETCQDPNCPDANAHALTSKPAHSTDCRCGLVPAPPLVNGRPSCCNAAANWTQALYVLAQGPGIPPEGSGAWCVGPGTFPVCASFCPFCGARLPEVPQ